jgi:uncharacterized protein (DUF1778 family)
MDLRVDPRRDALIRHAAEARGKTVTEFVLDAAAVEAEHVLADQRFFLLDEERWAHFNALLDRPAMDKPRLSDLLAKSSVLDRAAEERRS